MPQFIPDITIYAFRDGNIHSSAFTFVILSKSVYLFISQLVTRIFSKDTVNNASIRKSTLMLYLIPVMSSIITVSLGYICLNGKLSGSDSVIVFICLVLFALNQYPDFLSAKRISARKMLNMPDCRLNYRKRLTLNIIIIMFRKLMRNSTFLFTILRTTLILSAS